MIPQEQAKNFEARVNALWQKSHMQGRPPECWLDKLHRLDIAGVKVSEFRPSSAHILASIPDPLTEMLFNDSTTEVAYKTWLEDLQWSNMQRLDKRAGQEKAAIARKQTSRDTVEAYKEAHGWDDKFRHFKTIEDVKMPEPSAMQIADWWITQGKCDKSDKPNLLKRLRRIENIK